jgi:hypothetical protein
MPYTFSAHNVLAIRASSTRTSGAPLTLNLTDKDNLEQSSITIFTDNQILTDRLIEAINRVTGTWRVAPIVQEPTTSTSWRAPHPDDYRD